MSSCDSCWTHREASMPAAAFGLQGNSSAVTSNKYLAMLTGLKKKRAFEMSLRGAECFDVGLPQTHATELHLLFVAALSQGVPHLLCP